MRPGMIKQLSWRKRYFMKRLFLASWFCLTLLLTSTVWAHNRFMINPDKVAVAEIHMWKAFTQMT
jgi:hypothetical protein